MDAEVACFDTPAEFRAWLDANHASAREIVVRIARSGSTGPDLLYRDAVDQALCYGWIDGIVRRLDDSTFALRFTPRRSGSLWSEVNLKRAAELIDLGVMQPAGLAAYQQRDLAKARRYSYEGRQIPLNAELEARFRADPSAWAFFEAQAPSYRRTAAFWVMDAKRRETRERRLAALIEQSAANRRMDWMTRYGRTRTQDSPGED